MKAHFKYTLRAGMSGRLPAFAVIFAMNLVFIVLGSLGLLPLAAHITAVSLSGTAIAVMGVFNIVGDVAIIRRMFSAPGAYIYALTPAPRYKTLLSSILAIVLLNVVTMCVSIASVGILALNLAGLYTSIDFWAIFGTNIHVLYSLLPIALTLVWYLLFLMIIVFCIAVRKSLLHNKPAGGFLSVLLAFGVLYAVSLSAILLAPFGAVSRYKMFFTVTLGYTGMAMYALLIFIEVAALFFLTSRLLERKVNI